MKFFRRFFNKFFVIGFITILISIIIDLSNNDCIMKMIIVNLSNTIGIV